MIKLSVGEFQWKTTEQVYPFEKAADGSNLYCKQITFGTLPNSGYKAVAHNIPSFNPTKIFRHDVQCYYNDGNAYYGVPGMENKVSADNTSVYITSRGDDTSTSAYFRLIYAK